MDFDRLEVFTSYMGSIEQDTFEERAKEAKKFERRQQGGGRCRQSTCPSVRQSINQSISLAIRRSISRQGRQPAATTVTIQMEG